MKELGYYWIFPRDPSKNELNVGVGTFGRFNLNLKKMLEDFKQNQKIQGDINYVTGGLIPCGIQKPLSYKNILFVGDAGVGTFSLSGQGIYRALMSGDIAGKCITSKKPELYKKLATEQFIKWDVIGKNFAYVNFVFRKINPKLVLTSCSYVFRYGGMFH